MVTREYILKGLIKFKDEVKPSDIARVTAFKTKFLDDAIAFLSGENKEDLADTAERIMNQ